MVDMANLLGETMASMKSNGLGPHQIVFIGDVGREHFCTWEQFKVLADREYDSGFGGAEVDPDLIIVFDDGTIFKRGEYDGSEWWDVHRPFVQPSTETLKPIGSVFVNDGEGCASTLGELQDQLPAGLGGV